MLRAAPVNAPRLTLGRALGLPLKRPRVLTAAIVDHDGTLTGLQALGEPRARRGRALRARGARVPPARDGGAAAAGRARSRARRCPGPAPVTFYGEALTLYRSQLRREGARYEPLARLPLREWSSQAPGSPGPD